MTTSPTHLSGHVHGEEAVEIVRQAMQDAMNTHGPFSGKDQAKHMLAALDTAGLLATEQEWGVQYEAEMGADLIVPGTRDESENAVREYETATLVSRGVTAWREQA